MMADLTKSETARLVATVHAYRDCGKPEKAAQAVDALIAWLRPECPECGDETIDTRDHD